MTGRIALMLVLFIATLGAPARATVTPQLAPATLQGTVRTPGGETVEGARVAAFGVATETATTDAAGAFTLSLPPGIYRVVVSKSGFVTATVSNVALIGGQTLPLSVALSQPNLTSLRTIGSVSVSRGSSINTGAATQSFTPGVELQNLASPQINDVLQRTPDLNVQHMGSQPDTSIVLAGSQPYETQVLIDGHPIALGQYGVWLSEYFSSFLVGGVETQSGPGNTTPFANTAVGGTVNILTPNFTRKTAVEAVAGSDSYFSQYSNVLATGSAGRLQYVAGAGVGSSNGPYYETNKCVVIPDNNATVNTSASVGIIDYCGDASGSLFTKGEILKLRYDISPVTSLEAGFVGSQGGYLPQGTGYGQSLGVTQIARCLPSNPLACSNPANASLVGSSIDAYTWYPGSNVYSNQPIFTGQLRTTFAGNTLLVRPYAGNIDTIIEGSAESQYPLFYSPAGTVPSYAPGTPLPANPTQNGFEQACNTYGGFLGQIANPQGATTVVDGLEQCYQTAFSELEQDKLYGTTVSLLRPIGASLLDFTYDFHGTKTFAYYNTPDNIAVPDTTERYATFSLTGDLHFVRDLGVKVGLYNTTWKLAGSQPVGTDGSLGALNRTVSRFDPHVAFVYTPAAGAVSVRASYGTSETFPFAGQVSGLPFSTPPSATAPNGLFTQKNPFLDPETASEFGIGADRRIGKGVLSLDLQSTVIHNVFETLTVPGTAVAAETIIEPVNVARLRTQLATLKYGYAPVRGFGYNVALTADRSIVDGIPATFYANGPALPVNNVQICGTGLSTPGIPVCIPYLKGYGQGTFTGRDGTYAALGVDYEGKNNSYFQPPFAQVDTEFRRPVARGLELQFSVQNLLNTNNFSNLAAPNLGVPLIAGSSTGLTSITSALIPTPPRTFRLQARLYAAQ